MKRLLSAVLSLLLVFSLSVTAFAASSYFTYEGHNIFGFGPGSEFTDTDLFDNFKGVMPGDTLTETITVKNNATCCDFIKVYLRAEPHGDGNPLSSEVAKAETVVSMEDFLSQLTMTVWNGDTRIYEGSPDELDGLKSNVLLGTFRRNQGTTLTVELSVPAELGNEYANRVGEVDWIFTVEERNDPRPKPETDPDTVILGAEKLLNGKLPEGSDYEFILRDEEGQILQIVSNEDGQIWFDPITYSEEGTYRYTIEEQAGDLDGMIYDTAVYDVTVKVVKDKDYVAAVTYKLDGKVLDELPVFRNTTEKDPVETPDTGDDLMVWPYLLLFLLGLTGALTVLLIKRKSKGSK